jgi:two-component system, chemotaxis family, chemotaxis protein CheY
MQCWSGELSWYLEADLPATVVLVSSTWDYFLEDIMGNNVLLVDDSSTMRKIVGRSLRQAGIEFDNIFEAADGLQALEILEKESVDIVLSDINMPNMDGISFLREKANRPNIKGIPVFMISTETGDDIIGEAKSLGAVGAIKKPFTADMVNEVLGPFLK